MEEDAVTISSKDMVCEEFVADEPDIPDGIKTEVLKQLRNASDIYMFERMLLWPPR